VPGVTACQHPLGISDPRRIRGGAACSGGGTVHAGRVARAFLSGGLTIYAAIVSFTAATSCLSVNGFGRKLNLTSSGRFFSNASSA
jgi:hypothetical protein